MSHRDLDPWPCDLELLWLVGHHVVNTHTKFDRNRTIPGWVTDNLAKFGPNYATLWPWPLTLCPWTCAVDRALYDQAMYQIWARSINLWLSYWWLTTDFSSVFRGCSKLNIGLLKNALNVLHQVWWGHCKVIAAHTQFKNCGDILLGFQTTAARELLSDKIKNRSFWPRVKIRGGEGEMSGSILVAAPMAEPLVCICWPSSPRLLRKVFE